MVRFDWKLSLHFLWKKVGTNYRVSSRREKAIKKVSYFSFVVYSTYQKDDFYGIRQFVESSFIERITVGIDPWSLPYTGYDFTRYDNHTVRVCYVSAILGSETVTQYYWKFSFKICLHGASDNFRTRSFCIQQWKTLLSLNNFNWPYDPIIIEKIIQSRVTNYFSTLKGERHWTNVIYSTAEKSFSSDI